MKKLKDLCLSVLLKEGEDVVTISPEMVGNVVDMNFNLGDNYIKFDFETSYGKNASLVAGLDTFKNWLEMNKDKFQNVFHQFVTDFLSQSSETSDPSLNEIVDDDGNIMGDDDMPNNSTNSMVVSPKFDLEKIYKSFVPKSIRFYSGDLGLGVVSW